MKSKEKRQFIRLNAYHLVKYKSLSPATQQLTPVIATIKDIGAGGVCLKTQEYLPVSSLIELRINFPSRTTPIFTLAKVIWIKKIGKRIIHYELGAQFVEIEESLKKIINEKIKFVHQRLKNKKISLFKLLGVLTQQK